MREEAFKVLPVLRTGDGACLRASVEYVTAGAVSMRQGEIRVVITTDGRGEVADEERLVEAALDAAWRVADGAERLAAACNVSEQLATALGRRLCLSERSLERYDLPVAVQHRSKTQRKAIRKRPSATCALRVPSPQQGCRDSRRS